MKKTLLLLTMFVGVAVMMSQPRFVLGNSPGDVSTIYVYLDFDGDGGLTDLDGNGIIDTSDYTILQSTVGKCDGDPGYIAAADRNGDGCVNASDYESFPSITYQKNTLGLAQFTGEVFNLPSELRDILVAEIVARVQADYQAFPNVVFVTETAGLDYWYTWGIDDSAYVFGGDGTIPIDPHSPCPESITGGCLRLFGKAGSFADIHEGDAFGEVIFNPMHARTFAGSFALDTTVGDATSSEPPLFWGDSLVGTGQSVDIERLANAMGNSAAHEIAHLFGASHGGGLMRSESEKREAFYNKSFSDYTLDELAKTLLQAATADQFEPNDLQLNASDVSDGNYPNLTLDNPFDEDFYQVTVAEDNSEIRLSFSIDRTNFSGTNPPLMNHWTNVFIEYKDCDTCGWIWANPKVTDNGYVYEERDVPAGREYLIHVFQFAPRQPINYGMLVEVGTGILPPLLDRFDVDIDTDFDGTPDLINENDSQGSASEWPPGCDFSGELSIHDDSDVDWYQLDGTEFSIKAELSFDPTRGALQLFLDDVEATDSTLSDDGTKQTLSITGCGLTPSRVKVQGNPNYYNLCFSKVPLQESCQGDYVTWIPSIGSGTFDFTYPQCGPGDPVSSSAVVRDTMYAKITNQSSESVLWSVASWLDKEDGGYFPLVVELQCPVEPSPTAAQVTAKILNPITLADITWLGTAEGQCLGPDSPDLITGFSAVVDNMTSISPSWCFPGQGVLTIQGDSDSDSDGIPDQVEMDTGTDPYSDDTDGDGLSDGAEDANQNGQVDFLDGETDPRLWDTDGDGVSDGVESGLTSPNAHDTDPNSFQPDQDPATTTDPTKQDTDGDGLSDGEEDTNGNGMLDPGETSPIIQDIDSDGDGLPDSIDPCPFDIDCDNDGLTDGSTGSEDLNANGVVDPGETDPVNPDTDGDGVFDGTEVGLTEPEAIDGGLGGTDLTAGFFIPDADPSTTTDPTNPDSDGDGISDGGEDANLNGAYEPESGETDPNNDNFPPEVIASTDQVAVEGELIQLEIAMFTDVNILDTHTATIDWGDSVDETGSVSESDGSGTISGSHIYDDNGTYPVEVCAIDNDGAIDCDSLTVSVNNVPPTATFNSPNSVDEGDGINLSFSDPYDPSSVDTNDGFDYAFDCGDASGYGSFGLISSGECPTDDNTIRTVRGKIKDKDGDETEYSASVTVNNVPPTATFNSPSSVDEGDDINLSLSDPDDPSAVDTNAGFEYTFDCGDGAGFGVFSSSINALCPTDDDGSRIVNGKIRDKDGGESEYTTSVSIINVAPTIDAITAPVEPVNINNQPVIIALTFSDPGTADTHNVTWIWGDGNFETQTNATSPASASHIYTEAGVYSIGLTVTDDNGGSDQSVYQYIVVYDPEGGFVIGGGWIDSPLGAYTADPSLEGKATFGFVSKYKKGADVPIGNTEFQFHAGDLNFHSDTYQWLVVAGHKAQFKGTGTINGIGNYGFKLFAIDEKLTPSTDVDLFRIKIWDKDNGDVIVYDNQIGDTDDADTTTPIVGGSIVIHAGKK